MKLEPYRHYLEETVIPVRLACRTGTGWPFILSLWYAYAESSLFCATQASAKIVTYLRNDPRCAFEIASDQPPYCGIRGQAEATIVPARGGEILEQLLCRYLGGLDSELATNLLRKREAEVAICLHPVSVYAWNFSGRMKDSLARVDEKPCPVV